jgi:hypothetical protein
MSNVKNFGATGDGTTDDTAAIRHAVKDGDGVLEFPRGDYLISETIAVELDKSGRFAIDGSAGTAKIIMAGPGPALHLIGTHDRSADPEGFEPRVWARQRMPTLLNIEIEGRHPEADGVLVEGTMQPTFEGVLLRELRHGIHIHRRARNVLVSHCHIYHNRGVGVFFDHVNLHQTIITGSHISYCAGGGIKIAGSEIRNLQITGNDIEYNYPHDRSAPAASGEEQPVADVWIDCTDPRSSVREGTIVSNTIQANYTPGGANIRMVGHNGPGPLTAQPEGEKTRWRAGMFAISGNLIGSQAINVHLVACRGVVVTGNVIYSGHERNLQLDGSRNIVIGPNSFDHNPDYDPNELCTGVRLGDSHDCTLSGTILHDCRTGEHTVPGAVPIVRDGLLEIVRCRRINVSGCQVLDGYPNGVYVSDSSHVSIGGCMVLETRAERKTRSAVRWNGKGTGNLLTGNTFGQGTEAAVAIAPAAGVQMSNNLVEQA